jgi:4-nitrophenyl phosphatase/NagD protein
MLAERLSRIRGYLLDMDGTLYIGDRAVPGAVELMRALEGRPRLVLTNNSSASRRRYRDRLAALGMPVRLDDVLTSGEASAQWLFDNTPLRRPYVLGTLALSDACRRAGLTPATADGADSVLLGYDTTLRYARWSDACLLVAAGLPYYATHADRTCISPRGLLPDAGAIIAGIEVTTGRSPVVLGKPEAAMVEAGQAPPPHLVADAVLAAFAPDAPVRIVVDPSGFDGTARINAVCDTVQADLLGRFGMTGLEAVSRRA